MASDTVTTSKFLSLVLRHQPETIGIQLDAHGWVNVDELLRQLAASGRTTSRKLLDELVASNDKQRFAFSADGNRIRASQGHSVEIELGLEPQRPPQQLFHGTAERFIASIRGTGLDRRQRQHVHLSATREQAMKVGARHGRPLVLTIDCEAMLADGLEFFVSANGVWLTQCVPPQYIRE